MLISVKRLSVVFELKSVDFTVGENVFGFVRVDSKMLWIQGERGRNKEKKPVIIFYFFII
jgi:hypothetical protein